LIHFGLALFFWSLFFFVAVWDINVAINHQLKLTNDRFSRLVLILDGSGDLDPTDYSGDRVVINRIISEKCAELAIDLSALDFSRWKSRGENVERKLSVAENIRSSAFIERGSRVMRDCFARFRCLTCRAVWGSAKAECSIIHWNVTENGRLNLPTVETIFTQTCKRRGCDQRPTEPQFNLGTFSRRIDIALRIGAAMPLPPLAHVNEEKKKDPHKFMLCGYCYPKYVRGTSLIGGLHRLQMIEAGDL
jgi:hypothetical protein